MTKLTHLLIAITAAAGLQTAHATCTYPKDITIPEGATATKDEMVAASQAMKDYNAAVEVYIACLDKEEPPLPENATEEQQKDHEEQHKIHLSRHNAAVDALTAVAARYNEQVREYKKKNP